MGERKRKVLIPLLLGLGVLFGFSHGCDHRPHQGWGSHHRANHCHCDE